MILLIDNYDSFFLNLNENSFFYELFVEENYKIFHLCILF